MEEGLQRELGKLRAILRAGFVLAVLVSLITVATGNVRSGMWMFFGGMIGVANFYLIQILVMRLVNVSGQKKGAVFFVYFVKMLLLLVGVGLICYWLPVEPIGFMLGFGFILLAIVGVGLFYLLKGTDFR